MYKLKKLLFTVCLTLYSVLAYADDDFDFFSSGSGPSGPMSADMFIFWTAFTVIGFVLIGGLFAAVHTMVLSSSVLLKAKAVLRFFSPLAWCILIVAVIPAAICYSFLYFWYYGVENDPYAAAAVTVLLFFVSVLYFYLFNFLVSFFTVRPLGNYMVKVFAVLAVLSIPLGCSKTGKPLFFFLMMLLCALACLLAYRLYNFVASRKKD